MTRQFAHHSVFTSFTASCRAKKTRRYDVAGRGCSHVPTGPGFVYLQGDTDMLRCGWGSLSLSWAGLGRDRVVGFGGVLPVTGFSIAHDCSCFLSAREEMSV